MSSSNIANEQIINHALGLLQEGNNALLSALEQLAAPIYVTDSDGMVTYFNTACVGFSGRAPAVGKDRWCVTWKLFTEAGEFLPHDQCPMAEAIRTEKPIRGVTAVAERPDGTRVSFMPYATPLFDGAGKLIGAVNMLIDVTEDRQISELRSQAARCRRLAISTDDAQIKSTLTRMGDEYQEQAQKLSLGLRASQSGQ